ncbi:MAG TPA: hypothetical protein VIT91_20345 [Chthoniobacterales bacterium]
MANTLCDWSKHDIEKSVHKLAALVRNPQFYCRKCARVANTPDVLCKAKHLPIESAEEEFGALAGHHSGHM